MIRKTESTFFLFTMILLLGCSTNNTIVKYSDVNLENEKIRSPKYTKRLEELYKEYLEEKYKPEEIGRHNIKLLLINGAGFDENGFCIINQKDTLKNIGDIEGRCNTKLYELPSGLKKLKFEDNKRGRYIITLKKDYNYIEISGFKDTLIVRYLDFPKLRLCT